MLRPFRITRRAVLVSAWTLSAGLCGCQTIDAELEGLLLMGTGASAAASAAAASAPQSIDGPKILVEIRPEGRKPVMVPLPLSEPSYVQQALEQSGAIKRFRRMKIELYRQLPNGGGHKIPVAFDRGQRRVTTGSDYYLHPNDRVVVIEDTSNVVDDMMNNFAGPMKDLVPK